MSALSMVSVSAASFLARWAERSADFMTLKYDFVRDALIASVSVGVLCGVVGAFLVLRRLSLLGDAAGHATLPGLAVAFLITGSLGAVGLMTGALVSAGLAALTISALARSPRVHQDAAIGMVLATFFGVGAVLLSVVQRVATTSYAGLDALLLGNVAGVSAQQLTILLGVTLVAIVGTLLAWRPLALATFDEGFARAQGVPVRLIQDGLLLALALCVVVSAQAVGVVLVSAMLIIPPSTGLILASRLPHVVACSAALGALAGALGAWASFVQEGLATGPAMVLAATAMFVLAHLVSPRGVLACWRRARSPWTRMPKP